ncbi:hypothetical protein MK079_03100 [Candidatus Gracilibacteria bacterium]|nr:hypothetical protein [Candidatus Gracilibacteria bacterium]
MKQFRIEENDADQRLDKFLKKLFPSATRSLIYKMNRKDKIKIKSPLPSPPPEGEENITNNKFRKRDNEYKLQVGDEVKIFLSDKDFDELSALTPAPLPEVEGSISQKKILCMKTVIF